MTLHERDAAFLLDILMAGQELLEHTDGISLGQLMKESMRCRAVERNFEIIGEAARGLSQAFRERHADLPLAQVIGLRNVIAHGYSEIDHRVLLKVARDELPPLLKRLEVLLPELPTFPN